MQDQLGVVEADADGHLVAGDGADVLLVGADLGDLLVEVVGLDGEDLLDDLGREGGTACSWALQMALIWWSESMGCSAVSSLILRGKWRRNWELGLVRLESRYSRILAWIWPSDILTTLIILLYHQCTRDLWGSTGSWEMDCRESDG